MGTRFERSPQALRERLLWDEARLLAECDVQIHRTGGPGGQHRNKVASAVRLVHRPSGFVVTATERRSQHENKTNALSRLREAIAVGARCPAPPEVTWPPTVRITDQRLRVSEKNPAFYQVVALVLDELAAWGGELRKTADRLGVTSSSLTRFLAGSPKAWTAANRIRQAAGLAALRAP
jgi:hypothetical protein